VRIATVVGNRPQFVKAAAVSGPLRARHEELLIHTGQHYDDDLSSVFFRELGLSEPAHRLVLGSAGQAAPAGSSEQTAQMLSALAPVLEQARANAVLVYGDTNSTLAGGLAGAQNGLPVIHVEAGMRSFDRSMPEELNRVLTDHLATLMLCSSELAVANLAREGLIDGVELVGDVMVDVARILAPAVDKHAGVLERLGVRPGEYLLATAHRAGNVDDPRRLGKLVELLLGVPGPVVLALHPRTRARLASARLLDQVNAGVIVCGPLGYLDFATLLHHARALLSDSGGAQKEAYLAGVPCVTLRDRTEWPETVDSGWNVLVDLDLPAARAALLREAPRDRPQLYGDGYAGERVAQAVDRLLTA
jgi:UDP-GlcNAc3NAcA epimerase